jgi:hypothetical protein
MYSRLAVAVGSVLLAQGEALLSGPLMLTWGIPLSPSPMDAWSSPLISIPVHRCGWLRSYEAHF